MENKKWQERINYVIDTSTGKDVLVGNMVNYPGVFEADSEDELKKVARSFIDSHVEFTKNDLLNQEEPFELKLLTEKEWKAQDDNIDCWEIERMKRILQRPSIKAMMLNIIIPIIKKGQEYDYADEIAADIIQVLIDKMSEEDQLK